jgi:rhamnose transport system ATP-binding protein
MYRLATRVTVFRDSKYVGTYDVDKISNADLITAMVGREITDMFPKPDVELGDEVLRVENLSREGFFKDVSFSVRKGEILGLTGLVGARRTEVIQTIYGVEKLDGGKIFLEGKEVKIKSPKDAIKNGIGLLTEDRSNLGLILDWGIGRNITLTEIEKYGNKIFTNDKAERAAAKKLAEEVDTKAVSIFDKVSTLSGGNQQKVAVSKILASDLKVLIMDEPTKGIDVGAKAEIYDIMGQLAKQGYAIIMISSEMPEVLNMSDRIIVMCEGKVTGELNREEATQEGILEFAMAKSLKNTQAN